MSKLSDDDLAFLRRLADHLRQHDRWPLLVVERLDEVIERGEKTRWWRRRRHAVTRDA